MSGLKVVGTIAVGAVIGCTVVSLVAHRRVIAAMVKGEPLPEPPEWHKSWHPCLKDAKAAE